MSMVHAFRLFVALMTVMLVLSTVAGATDSPETNAQANLYRIMVRSQAQAQNLSQAAVDPLLRIQGGYLVLADPDEINRLARLGFEYTLVATDLSRSNLALDIHHDQSNAGKYPVVFAEAGTRLVQVTPEERRQGENLAPLPGRRLPIIFKESAIRAPLRRLPTDELDSLLLLVRQDSLLSYTEALQARSIRYAGTAQNFSAASWIRNKFIEFGYDSVLFDLFSADIDGQTKTCRNVVACKLGTEYPYHQIVIGAHYDAGEVSPGADDNGSGTAAVLEIARVLQNVDTRLTYIFIAFDAEEHGLFGSYHYAETAYEAGDRIVLMLNMDMIAHYQNQQDVSVNRPEDETYSQIWADLAQTRPAINLTAHVEYGPTGGSDMTPFHEYGYDILYIHEYIFSTVYHTSRDSTTYMNFDYMTRVVRGTMGTALVVDGSLSLPPQIIFNFPGSKLDLVRPGVPNPLTAKVEAYAGAVLVPGSVQLHYAVADQPADSLPMSAAGDDLYSVDMPVGACGDRVHYWISAREEIQGTVYYPPPDSALSAIVATGMSVVFEDDFNTDKGWTVSGNALEGQWVRDDPALAWIGPGRDFDNSGLCYLTGTGWTNDVRGGLTSLKSPAVDVSSGEAVVEFAVWYSNNLGNAPYTDVFKIALFNGSFGQTVDSIGPAQGIFNEWASYRLAVSDYFTPTAPISIRFDASDVGEESLVKAFVDAFKVSVYASTPAIITPSVPPCSVNIPYDFQLLASSCADPLTWIDRFDELAGTGLTLSSDGRLAGTALDTGRILFTALVTDTAGLTGEKRFIFHAKEGYVCGDANGDQAANVGDAVYLINFVFKGGAPPNPSPAGDANCDGSANVADAVYLINFVFKAGPSPCCP
jgi:hypothetical protein